MAFGFLRRLISRRRNLRRQVFVGNQRRTGQLSREYRPSYERFEERAMLSVLGVALTSSTIAENSSPNTVVGTLTAINSNAGESHTFNLVNDAGGHFALAGEALIVSGELDFESAAGHSIIVRATDSGGFFRGAPRSLTVDAIWIVVPPVRMISSSAAIPCARLLPSSGNA